MAFCRAAAILLSFSFAAGTESSPVAQQGRLSAGALSQDFQWLAVSGQMRGAVWNVQTGQRRVLIRPFRSAHFDDSGSLRGDIQDPESGAWRVFRFDPGSVSLDVSAETVEGRAVRAGSFLLLVNPATRGSSLRNDVVIAVRDVEGGRELWSKRFAGEAPRVWFTQDQKSIALGWLATARAAATEVEGDASLNKLFNVLRERGGACLLEVLNPGTGQLNGRLLVETATGLTGITGLAAAGDRVVVGDSAGQVRIYSLSGSRLVGRVTARGFGIDQAGKLMVAETEPGVITLYDLATVTERDRFVFSGQLAMAAFDAQGLKLFVLTADQTAYVLDLSAALAGSR